VGDPILVPQALYDLYSFREPACTLRHRHTVDGVFLGAITQANTEQEPAPTHHVHKRADFGQLDRIVEGQQGNVRADPKPFGLGRSPLQQRKLREEVETRRDVMFAGPYRVEAERANEPNLLNCLGEPADRIVALRVLGVEIDAELQSWMLLV